MLRFCIALLNLSLALPILAQTPATMTFDSLQSGTQLYQEGRLQITNTFNMNTQSAFVPSPPAMSSAVNASTLRLSAKHGGTFDVQSVDIREFNSGVGPVTVFFTGFRADGSFVQQNVTTDGVCCDGVSNFGFQTIPLASMTDLVELTWNPELAIYDNLALTLIDDPAVATMNFDGFGGGVSQFEQNQLRITASSSAVMNSLTNFLPDPPAISASVSNAQFTLTPLHGGTFDVLYIDVSELNNAVGSQNLFFTGFREDGSFVQQNVMTDGICCLNSPNFGVQIIEFTEMTNLVSFTWFAEVGVYDSIVTRLIPVDPVFNDRFEEEPE